MPVLIIATTVLIITAIAMILGIIYTYKAAFYSDRKKVHDPYRGLDADSSDEYVLYCRRLVTDIIELSAERVYITSRDGLKLSARYHHTCDGAPVEIFCHGYKSMHQRDFAGIHKIALEMGHNVLLIDQRAHGESEGGVISYGINERWDVIDWVKYVSNRFGEKIPIVLYGLSMGAATVLMASGEELPENVRCVVADCPFSSPVEIIQKVAAEKGVAASVAGILAGIAARILGFNLNETSAAEAVARAKVPILLIHGDEDDLVPYYMSEKIAEKNPSIQLETFREKAHAKSFLSDTERYYDIVKAFVSKHTER